MTDGDALLAAILAHPDEDTPRLMYADYLDESDRPEGAEFIRLQILLHNTTFIRLGGAQAKWPEPWTSRLTRARELAARYGREWGGAATRMYSTWHAHTFVDWYGRGFLARVQFPPGGFLANARAVFAEHPVTRVHLDGQNPRCVDAPPAPRRWFFDRSTRVDHLDWHEVPPCIFDRLKQPTEGFKWSSEANDALSAALVAYGRELADTPL